MAYLEVKISTREDRLLCTVIAQRTWRPIDVKEGVQTLTGITVVEQRLFGPGDRELREKDFLGTVFVEAQDVVGLTLERRPRLQAVWLEKVQEHGLQLRLAPKEARADRVVVLAAVEKNWRAYEFASEGLKRDPEVALAAALQNHKAVAHVPRSVWDDRIFALEMVKRDWSYIKSVGDDLLSDREVVQAAVEQNWEALQYASEELRSDRDLVVEAMRQGGLEVLDREIATPTAAERMYDDRDAMLVLVRQDWRNLEFADERFRSDREIAVIAVLQDWRALGVLSAELRNDPDIVMTAVQYDWCTLTTALQEFPVDFKIIEVMASRSWHILAYLPSEYLDDENIAMSAVKQDWKALQYVSVKQRANPAVVLEAVYQCPQVIEMDMVEEAPRGDKACILAAVEKQGTLLKVASEELKNDKGVCLVAVMQDWKAIEFCSERVRSMHDVVFAAVEQDITALRFATEKLRSDKNSMLDFVRFNERCIDYVVKSLLERYDFVSQLTHAPEVTKSLCISMVCNNWLSLKHMCKKQTWDRDIVAASVRQDWRALELATTINAELPEREGDAESGDEDSDDEPPDFFSDPKVMLPAVQGNWEMLLRAGVDIWKEFHIVLAAVRQEHTVIESAPNKARKAVWANRDVVLEVLKKDTSKVASMDKALWLDIPIVLEAMREDWKILHEAPRSAQKKLWQERAVAAKAIGQDCKAIQFMHQDLWEDEELVMTAVQQNWKALDFCPPIYARGIWAIKEIVLCAVQQDFKALKKTEGYLQEDREVVLAGVKQDWGALKLLSKNAAKMWIADPEVAMIGIGHDSQNFFQVDKSLHANPEVALKAVGCNPSLLQHVVEPAKSDTQVVLTAVRRQGLLLQHAGESARGDREVVLAAVKQDGMALEFASEELRDNRQVAEAAIRQNGAALELCSEALQADAGLVDLADII